jgi:heat shock protein HtpX
MQHQIAHNRRESGLIIALFVAVWLAIGVVVGLLLQSALAGALFFVFLAVLAILYSYFLGGATVLAVSGARRADPQEYPQLHNIVEAVAIGAGLPKPEVYVIDDASPNAFATGRDPQHAAVTVTSGLLQMMDREELEGVVAHELSHIRNYDVRLVLIVVTLVAMAGLLGSLAIRASWGTGRSRDGQQIGLILIVAGLLLTLLGYIVGPLMQLALSRQREYLADASGVELTRNPAGLLSALRKLQANDKPLATYNHATAAMFIDNPLEHHSHAFNHLFDTHPPLEDRIAVLERILNVQQT